MTCAFCPTPITSQELRHQTGLDEAVRDYRVSASSRPRSSWSSWRDLIGFLLPLYAEEGKTALVIAVGCTGGHHRSVAVTHALADYHPSDGLSGHGEPPGHDAGVRRCDTDERLLSVNSAGAGPQDRRHRRRTRAVHHAAGAEAVYAKI
ncbi:MAG: hypothetical protein ACLSHM_01410 [Vescimonas sp.]